MADVEPRWAGVSWAILLILLALAGLSTLWWPLGRDQGIFAWVGDVIVEGGAPYRNAWDVKGPATHLFYALARLMFGRNMWGIRVLDLGMVSLAAAVAWRTSLALGAGRSAPLAPFLFVAWYWQLDYWNSSQPDGWAGILLLVVLFLLVRRRHTAGGTDAIAMGVLLGACALLKPVYLSFWILPLLDVWIAPVADRRRVFRLAVLAFAGSGLAVGAVVAWLSAKGALIDFVEIQAGFNRVVHQGALPLGIADQLSIFFSMLARPDRVTVAPLVVVGTMALWRRDRRQGGLALAAAATSLFCLVLQSKYYVYQWIPLHVPIVLLAAAGLGAIRGMNGRQTAARGARRMGGPLAVALLAPLMVVNLVAPLASLSSWIGYLTGKTSREAYYGQFGKLQPDFSFLECEAAAQYLDEHTAPTDAVLVWGFDPLINHLSGRLPPTRFGFHYPLTRGPQNPYEIRWRKDFLEDLAGHPPALVVVADDDQNNLMPRSSLQYLQDFPEFRAYLERGYRPEGRVGRYLIWRRR